VTAASDVFPLWSNVTLLRCQRRRRQKPIISVLYGTKVAARGQVESARRPTVKLLRW